MIKFIVKTMISLYVIQWLINRGIISIDFNNFFLNLKGLGL